MQRMQKLEENYQDIKKQDDALRQEGNKLLQEKVSDYFSI